jgi:hypothetical protein
MSEKDHNKTITGFPLIYPAETPKGAMGVVNIDERGDIPVRQFSMSDRQRMLEKLTGPAADHLFRLIAVQQAVTALERGDSFSIERAKKGLEEDSPADLAFLENLRAFRDVFDPSTGKVSNPSAALTFSIEALRCALEFGKRFGIFDLPLEDWGPAFSEISDLPQKELIRRLQRGQPDSSNMYRRLCFEVATSIKAIGAQLVFWWHNQEFVPAIYCPNLQIAYYIHALFISRNGVIGWRVCPWCNEPFEQNRADQEYCIPKHGDAYRMARMRWELKQKAEIEVNAAKKRGKKDGVKKTR